MLARTLWTKICALIALFMGLTVAGAASATTWYFAPNGDDWTTGNGSSSRPWQNPGYHNASFQPGDILMIGPGTYTPQWGWGLTASGSPAGGYITLQCAPNFASKIAVTTQYMNGISILHGGSYWDIKGCDVSSATATAITAGGSFSAPYGPITHIIIDGNYTHDSACMGIGAGANGNNGLPVDYIIFRNNIAYNNARTATVDCSGIGLYEPVAADSAPGYHILVQGNISYNNFDCDACHAQTSDGNGIIIDDFLHTQNPGVPYTPATLVENNLAVNNGGNGIHIFLSQNVTVRNNTAWGNVQDPKHCGGYEIGSILAVNVQFYDNLAYATGHTNCNGATIAGLTVLAGGSAVGTTVGWNMAYNLWGNNFALISATGVSKPQGNWTGTDPHFAAPFRPTGPVPASELLAAFTPTTGSKALMPYGGIISDQSPTDITGKTRRTHGTADLGVIQVGN